MSRRMWDEAELKGLINKEAPKLENIKDVTGGVEATGDLTVKEGLYAEKNASVGEDLDVAGDANISGSITEESRPIVSIIKLTDVDTELIDVYEILQDMNSKEKHFFFDISALSPSGKPFYLSCWDIQEVGSSSYNVAFQDLVNGKNNVSQVGNRHLTVKAYLGTLKDRNEFDTIKIGSTTLNETQLQALLALLEN